MAIHCNYNNWDCQRHQEAIIPVARARPKLQKTQTTGNVLKTGLSKQQIAIIERKKTNGSRHKNMNVLYSGSFHSGTHPK